MTDNPPIKIHLFRNEASCLRFKKGEVIFRQGEAGEEMFIVRSGRVELRIGGSLLYTVEQDEVFGEMAIVDDAPRCATAIVMEDCEVVAISQQRFLQAVQANPVFAFLMLKVLSHRLRATNAVL